MPLEHSFVDSLADDASLLMAGAFSVLSGYGSNDVDDDDDRSGTVSSTEAS